MDNRSAQALEMIRKQSEIENRIYTTAIVQGLTNDNIEPITDGVCDACKFLQSSPRIAVVLKEPYDDFKDGQPYGGGYSIVRDCFKKPDARLNKTWQPLIYCLWGAKHGLYYDDMDSIADDPEMVSSLQEIAYINVSKTPAYTRSSDSKIKRCYSIWKDVLHDQLNLYDPDIILFGATLKYFLQDLPGLVKVRDIVSDGVFVGEEYTWKDKKYISVHHPNNRIIARRNYVNAIIDAIMNLQSCGQTHQITLK